jgi:enamine deaminase RidA (YjgF/YER057c/UK114 family)
MTARLVNPPELAAPRGYSHGAWGRGRVLAIAGQIGWDASGKLVSPDFVPQFAQAIANVAAVLRAGNARPEDLISLRIYVTDKQRYLASLKEVGAAYRSELGTHYPAMALVEVADLLEDGALVEIEGLAMVPDPIR